MAYLTGKLKIAMNRSNKCLFLCLCKDLGFEPLRETEYSERNQLKNELLMLAELEFDKDSRVAFEAKFGSAFRGLSPETISIPSVFRDVYQLLAFQLKVKDSVSQEQQDNYISSFLERERITSNWRPSTESNFYRLFIKVSRYLSMNLDLRQSALEKVARHGPGAVFDGSEADDKSEFRAYYEQLHTYLTGDFFFGSITSLDACLGDRMDVHRSIVARFSLVPKDWKGPRGVFISPKEAMFAQLGIDELLKGCISSGPASSCYNPKDQSPSRESSWIGSYCKMWSTIDLSDASDLVPFRLICKMFAKLDVRALACTRPTFLELPNGDLHRLRMFAPMGDGKTFAVLSFVCICCGLASMLDQDGVLAAHPVKDGLIRAYANKLRVFGDDIAVHTQYYERLLDNLQTLNLRVNRNKSFSKGYFRESCGLDAYKGIDVTPVRQKVNLEKLEREDFQSLVDFHNRCVTKYPHLIKTIAYLHGLIIRLYPRVGYTRFHNLCPTCLQDPHASQMNARYLKRRWVPSKGVYEIYVCTGLREKIPQGPLDDRYLYNASLFPSATRSRDSVYGGNSYRKGSPRTERFLARCLREAPRCIVRSPKLVLSFGWVVER